MTTTPIPIKMSVSTDCVPIRMKIATEFESASYEMYGGEIEITPSAHEQILATANKIVPDDITVQAVPCAEVSNKYGTTLTILS